MMGKAAAQSPSRYLPQRIAEGHFICDICGNPWPISHMMIQPGTDDLSGSRNVGKLCCWEPKGSSIDRDLLAAFAATEAGRLTAKELTPPSKYGEAYFGTPTVPESFSFVSNVDPNPINLTRGGAAVSVALTGIGFVSGDTIAYGSAGITDATPPVLVSETSRTLSVQASALMAVGRYSFTFNGTVWPEVFSVR